MQELILTAVLVVSFICVVSAYGLGVKHGLSVGRGVVPKPIINAPKANKEPKTGDDEDILPLLMGYSYETAITGLKKEMTNG